MHQPHREFIDNRWRRARCGFVAERAGFGTRRRLGATACALICLLVSIGLPGNSAAGPTRDSDDTAQTATTVLPDWAVLVLKPVGADRVRPITGVVVSEQGLVIVPFDFAAPGDQIIVLDGGTDIVANGRAAIVRQQIPEAGLTLLSAPSLRRPPAHLSGTPPAEDDEIRLATFPPAELIAQGAAPLSVATQVSIPGAPGQEAEPARQVLIKAALPNLTGPLLDRCGNLVGFSSADGVQSMETTKAPTYLWAKDLLRVLQRLQIEVAQTACEESTASFVTETGVQDEATQSDSAAQESVEDLPAGQRSASVPLPVEKRPAGGTKARLMSLGFLALALLAGLAWLVFKRRKKVEPSPGAADDGSEHPAERPPFHGSVSDPLPTDCVVEISGHMPDGTPFSKSHEVNSAAINLVIGRGQADITIESEQVNREHARLSGSADMLTISDLGSIRGTWINRVPCLKGEIMCVEAEDTIFLGDVSFRIRVSSRPDGDREFRRD